MNQYILIVDVKLLTGKTTLLNRVFDCFLKLVSYRNVLFFKRLTSVASYALHTPILLH
jgi:hypothetical protein